MRISTLLFSIGTLVLLAPNNSAAQEFILPSAAELQKLYTTAYTQGITAANTTKIATVQNQLQTTIKEAADAYAIELRNVTLTKFANQDVTALAIEEAILHTLEANLATLTADSKLLTNERTSVYENGRSFTGSTLNQPRMTASYAELQAKEFITTASQEALENLVSNQSAKVQALRQQELTSQYEIFLQIAKILAFIAAVIIIERIVQIVVFGRIKNDSKRYALVKTSKALVYGSLVLILLITALVKKPSLFSSVAIIGAGLAIALQDVIKDVVGWLMIIQSRLFTRGDRISIGTVCGEVVDYGPLRTTLLEVGLPSQNPTEALERTGKLLSIPNTTFLQSTLTNHSTTSTFLRSEITLTITFESDAKKAKEILTALLEEFTGVYAEEDARQTKLRTKSLYYIPHRITGNQVYTSIGADGVEFTLRFTVPIGERRPVVSKLSEEILAAFEKEKTITLAYSTIRYFTQK